MKTIEKSKVFEASPEDVFDVLDDLGVTGMHMQESSMPMMGGKMNLEFLTSSKTGLDTKYRWKGKVLWMALDFIVVVKQWIRGSVKTWETEPGAKMILYSWFRMRLAIDGSHRHTTAILSITYDRPKGFLYRLLSYILADWYCRWCLNNMLNDAVKRLESNDHMIRKIS